MKITNYRQQQAGSKVHALFDLEVDVKIPEIDATVSWINKNWKLIRGSQGGLFPVSPSFGEEISPGQKKWISYDEPDPRFAKEITKKLMQLLDPFIKPSAS